MGAVELDTAVREELGMVIVVYNDDAYGAEVHLFADQADKHGIVRFPETDLAAIARGYGCEAMTVRSLDDLGGVQEWLDGPRNRPLVIDAKIAGDASPLMKENHGH
jgi:thiamine pyrophosphate-dependent acetolactate synthase large subunit-like protein